MTERRENSKATRATGRRRMYIWSLVLMIAGSMALPLTGYVAVGVLQAQEAASDDSNPRADYWREVRGGVAGYSAVTGQETGVLIQNGGQNWRQVRNGPVATYGAWVILAIIAALAVYHLLTGGYKMGERTGRKILRWPSIDRALHWYTAILFIILAITGLSLLWGRAVLIPVLGKEGFAAWAGLAKPLHDYLALFFTAGFVVALLKWMHHNWFKSYDMEWLLKGGGYLGGGHPPAGFANAGHKLLYWTLVFAGGAMVVSGLFLLFPNWGTERAGMQLANSIHGITSLICVGFICLHIYLATIGSEGSLEGMLHGYVDEQYAKNHHPLWYEEVMAGEGQAESVGGAPSPAPAAPEK
ncbi:MAG: formate dehydrogenase subunit gamma [Gammaproteobacteria bacterium]|nr:MAG: formate dehydrogenase subunit gamma [Gammaproteobacteria bacterium]